VVENGPVRLLFPVLTFVALLVFGLSAVLATALSLLIPAIFIGLAGAALAARQIIAAVRLVQVSLQSVAISFRYCRDVARCIFQPLREMQPSLDDGSFPRQYVRLKPPLFIELHRVQQQVAQAIEVAPVDELWLSPGTELGIGEVGGVRFLMVGLGLLRMLSAEELRAALAHEFGHALAGHLRLGRYVLHTIRMLLHAQLRFRWYDPALWGSGVALALMRAIYLPWSRARELEADRISGQMAGGSTAIATLRRLREEAPIFNAALLDLLRRSRERRSGPVRLVESAAALAALVPAIERRKLSVIAEGDPLDLGGRTHPPTAARIAALSGVEALRTLPPAVAIPAERLGQLDERLTRQWLAELGLKPELPTAVAIAAPPAAPEFVSRSRENIPRTREELERPTSDGLELDLDHRWNRK
jgi:Zn-dependent protease with chaperone function